MNLYIIFIIIIIITYILYNYVKEQNSLYKRKENKWCILLTTCVNKKNSTFAKKNSMLLHYTSVINRWLETGLHIFVVDSTNYRFDEISHKNLTVYSFYEETFNSSSFSEAFSILKLLDNMPQIQSYSHVLKVTGRYYIPNMHAILNSIGTNDDLYIQHINNTIDFQNSEVFGFRRTLAPEIFNPVIGPSRPLMEKQIWDITHESKYSVVVLPKMSNVDLIPRGGDGYIVNPL